MLPLLVSLAHATDATLPAVAVGTLAEWHCSGLLLDEQHVLTARHCLPAARVGFGPRLDQLEVIDVHGVHVAPRGLDAVVLRLERPHSWTEQRPLDVADTDGHWEAWGFGLQVLPDGRARVGVLHAVDFTHGLLERCDRLLAASVGCRAGELVIQAPGAVDTCRGDSGGPVMRLRDGRWEWLGIVSRSVGRAAVQCGDGGIYVSSAALTDWLGELLEHDGQE